MGAPTVRLTGVLASTLQDAALIGVYAICAVLMLIPLMMALALVRHAVRDGRRRRVQTSTSTSESEASISGRTS